MAYDYDLLVLGAGSGGLAAAKNAAKYGKRVAIIEGDKVGGTCVIRGCVPKKIMSYAGILSDAFTDSIGYGFSYDNLSFDFSDFAAKRNAEIDRLNALHIALLEKAGVTLITGFGTLTGAHEITVGDTTYSAEHIILATGSSVHKPDIPGIEHCLTSDDIWELHTLPQSLLVIGAGYIALEFASIFNALGSDVTVMLRREKILRGFDDETRTFLQQEMSKKGIKFITEKSPSKFTLTDSKQIKTNYGSNESLTSNHVMIATGRVPNKSFICNENLVKIGNNKEILVNEYLQTSSQNIYAVGDLINRVNLTPVAIKHGRLITNNLYTEKRCAVDDDSPTAIFTSPPVGTAGLCEQKAHDQGYQFDVYKTDFKPMKYQLTQNNERAFMKMIVDQKTDQVLGLHMVGADAPEIIQGFAVAVRAGLTKTQFDATVAIHPSSAEEFVLMK